MTLMTRGIGKLYFIFRRKTIITVISGILILCVCCVIVSGITANNAVMTGTDVNWGLSFNSPNGIPTGNATAEKLKLSDAYYIGDVSRKNIYLTFDAGYENGYTENILDVLKKHNVKATFFLVGNFIETAPELVKRMVNEGHTVGNHTMTHPDMSSISDIEAFKKEVGGLESLYKEVTGKDMLKIYRPPQGKYSEENLKMAQSMGYKTVFWSLAYVDWYNDAQPTREQAFDKLLPRIHNGAIVLLHSTSKTNSEILDELLSKWEDMGYELSPITELIKK